MKKWLIALVPATVIVILLAYVLGSHVIPQSVQDNLANAAEARDTSTLPDDAGGDNVTGALPQAPIAPPAAPPDNDAAPAATPAQNQAMPDRTNAGASDDRDDPDAEAQAREEIGAAVRRATLNALDSGEQTHWHKDGLSGDIVVSDVQDDGAGGACRTVTATMGTDDDQKQSGDHVWCQPAGGDWAPR